ncbi:MAG TPA: hypothetical protein VFD03_05870 [Clostridia bacterium]|nr:hypothetical protein [Clostridia bacterium]
MSENRDQMIEKLHQMETLVDNALCIMENEAENADNMNMIYLEMSDIIDIARHTLQLAVHEYRILWDIERSENSLKREMKKG